MEKSRKKNVKSSFVNYLVKRVFLRLKAHYSIGVAFSLRILFSIYQDVFRIWASCVHMIINTLYERQVKNVSYDIR
jgi:hypothetical protein